MSSENTYGHEADDHRFGAGAARQSPEGLTDEPAAIETAIDAPFEPGTEVAVPWTADVGLDESPQGDEPLVEHAGLGEEDDVEDHSWLDEDLSPFDHGEGWAPQLGDSLLHPLVDGEVFFDG